MRCENKAHVPQTVRQYGKAMQRSYRASYEFEDKKAARRWLYGFFVSDDCL
jgi:hypothetical protein